MFPTQIWFYNMSIELIWMPPFSWTLLPFKNTKEYPSVLEGKKHVVHENPKKKLQLIPWPGLSVYIHSSLSILMPLKHLLSGICGQATQNPLQKIFPVTPTFSDILPNLGKKKIHILTFCPEIRFPWARIFFPLLFLEIKLLTDFAIKQAATDSKLLSRCSVGENAN